MPKVLKPEASLQKAVIDLLNAEKVFHLRMNSGNQFGSYASKKTGKVSRWRIKGHAPGTADLLVFLTWHAPEFRVHEMPRPVWIELKAPGEKQSLEQQLFEKQVIAIRHEYKVFDSIDKFQMWLKVNKA